MNGGSDSFRNPCEQLRGYRLSYILIVERYESVLYIKINRILDLSPEISVSGILL